MDFKLRVFPSGYIETNAYLLSSPALGKAILFDAPHFLRDEIQSALDEDECTLDALLLTHGHYDHIGDAAKISREGVPLYGHKDDQILFEEPQRMMKYAYPQDIELEGFTIDHWVEQGSKIELLGLEWEVRHVPGHCPGNVLFYCGALKAVVVGDALFAGSIGRTDLPGGDFSALERSIREQIYTLPKETAVLPGHGPSTSVGDEIQTNPYVSAE